MNFDHVLLAIGGGPLSDGAGRLRWAETNLIEPDWLDAIGVPQVDAAFSATALRWLNLSQLAALYGQLGKIARPGGVFLNGDHLGWSPQFPAISQLAAQRRESDTKQALATGQENYEAWWQALSEEPALAELFNKRERRFRWRQPERIRTLYDTHVVALLNAGLREVSAIWQILDNGVILPIR